MPRDKDVKRVVRKRMAATGERYTEARDAIRPAAARRSAAKRQAGKDAGAELVEVVIPERGGIRVHLGTGQHSVVLKQREHERSLQIWIGIAEANAIAVVLRGWTLERPLTSDLMVSMIRGLGAEVERVIITRVVSDCFYAEVHVRRNGSPLIAMDARPSDALGVAVRTQAPIFVAADVMDARGAELETMRDAVTPEEARIRTESGAEARVTAYAPVLTPTHVLVDVASDRVVTLLGFPLHAAQAPAVGTLLTVGMAAGSRQYRVLSIEPGGDGLTRLRAELVAEPTSATTHIVNAESPPQG